jgi:hypothetical protein
MSQAFDVPEKQDGAVWRSSFAIRAPSRNRVKSPQSGRKWQMSLDNDRFPPKSHCRLSYPASFIPRIVRSSDMAVCGDRQFVMIFDPAETT